MRVALKDESILKRARNFYSHFRAQNRNFLHFGALKHMTLSKDLVSEFGSKRVSLGFDNDFGTPWPLGCTANASVITEVSTINKNPRFEEIIEMYTSQ